MSGRVRRTIGWACCLAAFAVIGVVVGQKLLTDHHTAQAQATLRHELAQAPGPVRRPAPVSRRRLPVAHPAPAGHALAELRIPRFGATWSWIVVEGTTSADLAKGPGHYSATPLPGERGNVAIAAHRAGHGDPFIDFDRLRPGDRVELRQGDAWWRYRVTNQPQIVPVTADWVLDPLHGRRLTLTTCWPKWGSSKRMFVRAVLEKSGLSPGHRRTATD